MGQIKSSKAQSSTELVVMMCLLSLVFSVFVTNILYKNTNLEVQKVNQNARCVSNLVSSELNNVYMQGDGYSRNFTLPQSIREYRYNISIVDNMVYLFVANNNTYLRRTIPKNVSGGFKKGSNCLSNKNGVIYVNS